MGLLSNIVTDFKITSKDLPRIQSQLFYDGPNSRQSLERFGILMFFATLIAAYGVIGDSTATVIGAMLIAPLMTPVLAIAAAVVMGICSAHFNPCWLRWRAFSARLPWHGGSASPIAPGLLT